MPLVPPVTMTTLLTYRWAQAMSLLYAMRPLMRTLLMQEIKKKESQVSAHNWQRRLLLGY